MNSVFEGLSPTSVDERFNAERIRRLLRGIRVVEVVKPVGVFTAISPSKVYKICLPTGLY